MHAFRYLVVGVLGLTPSSMSLAIDSQDQTCSDTLNASPSEEVVLTNDEGTRGDS